MTQGGRPADRFRERREHAPTAARSRAAGASRSTRARSRLAASPARVTESRMSGFTIALDCVNIGSCTNAAVPSSESSSGTPAASSRRKISNAASPPSRAETIADGVQPRGRVVQPGQLVRDGAEQVVRRAGSRRSASVPAARRRRGCAARVGNASCRGAGRRSCSRVTQRRSSPSSASTREIASENRLGWLPRSSGGIECSTAMRSTYE